MNVPTASPARRRKPTPKLPNGARALMGSRQELVDSLDYFPTPPWATRALIEHVLSFRFPRVGSVWEPACGEGHIAEVLHEYFSTVFASDIHDYGYRGASTFDFLDPFIHDSVEYDWIITNPPFGETGENFVVQALSAARIGVAMFMRVQWLDSIGRYRRIFAPTPPTQIAFFAERVNLCKGRWEPNGSTATAYCWLVWIHGQAPRAPMWIPPGCKINMSRPDDIARFTAHPVQPHIPG